MTDLILRNVTLPSGRVADVSISRGVVAHVGASGRADASVDCRDLFCLPAAVDMHVHMRGGIQSQKEDWESGSRSAIAGGVTIVVDQPNTIPPLTTPGAFSARVEEAMEASWCGFAVNAGVVPEAPLEALWHAGAMAFGEIFAAPSSYGSSLDPSAIKAAFQRIRQLGGLATVHAEEVLAEGGRTLADHDRNRPGTGEARAVRAVSALKPDGMRLHFCHLSTAASVDAAKGTIMATPHHLFLSRESFGASDAFARVNPPLREEAERRALWSRWDSIDVIASDHAPHTPAEKSLPFDKAPSGIPGVETMVPLVMAEVVKRAITLQSVIEKTSYTPASILGIPKAGFEPGDRADFALYTREISTVQPEQLHSKCGWSPFEGMDAVFPEMVIMNGELAYQGGEYHRQRPRWYAGRGYHL